MARFALVLYLMVRSDSLLTCFGATRLFITIPFLFRRARFMHCGRLVGHNGAVCALTMKGGLMATGSRDRLIKVCGQ